MIIHVVPGSWNDINSSIAEIDLSDAIRLLSEVVESLDAAEIEPDDLRIRQSLELPIAGPVVQVSMGIHYEERQLFVLGGGTQLPPNYCNKQ